MERRQQETQRDRAIWFVRLATTGGVAGALGLTWLFSNAAEAYVSGRSPVQTPPRVPVAAAPVQKPRDTVTTVVHHPAGTAGGSAPRPPSSGPVSAPAPPPPPTCVSTPSHPC